MIGPRMSQFLLYEGTATMAHVQTIIGSLNLVVVLVTDSRNQHLREPLFQAQKCLAQLVPDATGAYQLPEGPSRLFLSKVIARADQLLALQSNGALIRALDYMDRAFQGKTQAEVVSLAEAAARPTALN